ncbi:MAG: S49 family peptidase [Burkholderiaceae bacterium]|jgi:protease-4|nr:S49 family peptidase [Burkholderiaceae bacterium]
MTDSNRTEPQGFGTMPDNASSAAAGAARSSASASSDWERSALEKLLFSTLKEQRRARHWRIFFRSAWLVVLVALVWLGFSRAAPSADKLGPHTAVVQIRGEIAYGADASAEYIIGSMKTALQDEDTKGLVLLINSPGGSPVQAGLIVDAIKRMRTKYNKPIYAVAEESCTSAAYYIASVADQIFVDKASLVGSVGVLMDGFGFTGLMDKLGIERRLLVSGENKGFLDSFSPMNSDQRAHAQEMLDQIHQQFIDVVKTGRGDRLKLDTPGLFSGLFWTGQRAVDIGLADQLGSVDSVARDVIKAKDLVDYTRRDNMAERLAKKFGAAFAEVTVHTLSTMPALH